MPSNKNNKRYTRAVLTIVDYILLWTHLKLRKRDGNLNNRQTEGSRTKWKTFKIYVETHKIPIFVSTKLPLSHIYYYERHDRATRLTETMRHKIKLKKKNRKNATDKCEFVLYSCTLYTVQVHCRILDILTQHTPYIQRTPIN